FDSPRQARRPATTRICRSSPTRRATGDVSARSRTPRRTIVRTTHCAPDVTAATPLFQRLSSARVIDLVQPRFASMPSHPAHQPAYFYGLNRRHGDNYRPQQAGQRSGSSGVLHMKEHSGTHIDALCHQAADLMLFGGIRVADVETTSGFTQLGV